MRKTWWFISAVHVFGQRHHQRRSHRQCGKPYYDPVYTYEEPDLLSANGTVGGNLMDYSYEFSYTDDNSVDPNARAARIRTECSSDSAYFHQVDAAEAHSYPWHVALAKKGLVKCSGTLIHESWVLTSGNCKMRQTTVYAGVSNLVQYGGIGVQSRDIVWAESVRHPWGKLPANKASSYRSSSSNRTRSYRKLDHNLVLLKMKKPFTLTKYVQPACLPDRKLKLKTGTRCATTGWGWASVTSLLMQQVATVLPWSQCAEVKEYSRSTQQHHRFCVSNGCTCLENGMPYMCRVGDKFSDSFVLAGVKVADGRVTTRKNGQDAFKNSKNVKCGSVPRYYIPIAPYVGWIEAVLKNRAEKWTEENPTPRDIIEPTPKTTSTTRRPSAPPPPLPKLTPLTYNSTNEKCRRMAESSVLTSDDLDILQIICQIESFESDKVAEGCIHKNDPKGLLYRGGMDRTRYGLPCRNWDELEKYDNYKRHNPGMLQRNYCRNPDGDERGPWCFFWAPRSQKFHFGYCDIKTCED